MPLVRSSKKPISVKVDDRLKNIFEDRVKNEIDKGNTISLKDFDRVFGTSKLKTSEKDNEPKKGTDAYYIKHGLPFKELDPYD